MARTRHDHDHFSVHEAFDRTFLFAEFLSEYLTNHPALSGTPRAKKQIDEAVALLYSAYREIGRRHLGNK